MDSGRWILFASQSIPFFCFDHVELHAFNLNKCEHVLSGFFPFNFFFVIFINGIFVYNEKRFLVTINLDIDVFLLSSAWYQYIYSRSIATCMEIGTFKFFVTVFFLFSIYSKQWKYLNWLIINVLEYRSTQSIFGKIKILCDRIHRYK